MIDFFTLSFDVSAIPSLEVRFELWVNIFKLINNNWMFGLGPMNDVVGVTDNQYLKWLLYYGIAGLILYLIFFVFLLIYVPINHMKTNRRLCYHVFILLIIFL